MNDANKTNDNLSQRLREKGYDDLRQYLEEEGIDTDVTVGELMEEDDRGMEELLDDIRDLPGKKIVQEADSLYTTLEIVNKNYSELTDIVDWYLDQDIELFGQGNREEMKNFQKEYLRRMHNYSASVHSLIEHTYTILDRYEDKKSGLKEGYFDEIESRGLDVKVDLLKQLRHYTQKRELPPIASKLELDSRGEESTKKQKLILEKDKMMDWDGWNADVREELERREDEIEITHLAEEYQAELNDFYNWLEIYFLKHFYEEVVDYTVTKALIVEKMDDRQ